MKNAKKFLAMLLTLIMVLALSVPTFAMDLTIKEPAGAKNATYNGYQILYSSNNSENAELFAYTLNNKYTDALLIAINGNTKPGETGYVAADGIIPYIAALDEEGMRTFANDVYAAIVADNEITPDAYLTTGNNTVAEGYWLIAQTSAADKLETQSLVIVDTVGKEKVEITSKKDTFTVEKTVTDESQLTKCTATDNSNHVHTAACYDWTKTNESPVGATVKFQIATKVPSNMAGYEYNAYFIVGDTLSEGLTLKKDSIKVYIDDEEAAATDYTVRYSDGNPACEDGYTFQVALVNPKACADKEIIVYYDAVVNEDAVLALTGNPNEADVTYNTKDDVSYGGEPGDSDGFPKGDTVYPDGKTPGSFTVTYVTGLKFLKIDGKTKNPLNGAEFTITGTTETTELKWEQKYTPVAEGEEGTHYLLKDGSYTTQAPITNDYMKEQLPGAAFEGGYVMADTNDPDADTDVTINGTRYRVATADDVEEHRVIYTLVKANSYLYAEVVAKYTYSEGWVAQTATKEYKEVIKVDENGIAKLPGLAAGTYKVTESKVPAGYNPIEDFEITVTWYAPTAEELNTKGGAAQCTWTVEVGDQTLTLDETDNTALYKLVVENNAGTELPSTGGMGTTLFYVLGGILLVGAAVLLITKKRMSAER